MQNPDFFNGDSFLVEFITIHKSKVEIYLIIYEFKLVLIKKFTSLFRAELENHERDFNLKSFLLL